MKFYRIETMQFKRDPSPTYTQYPEYQITYEFSIQNWIEQTGIGVDSVKICHLQSSYQINTENVLIDTLYYKYDRFTMNN